MDVCRLVNKFPSGTNVSDGLAPTFYHLSLEQAKLGDSVYVVSKKFPYQDEKETINGIQVYRTRSPYNLFAICKLRQLQKKHTIDVIHGHATSCWMYSIVKGIMPKTKSTYAVHVHGTTKGVLNANKNISLTSPAEITFQERLSAWRQQFVWKRADVLIAVSNFIAKELVNLYKIPQSKISVAHNGVDVETFKRKKDSRAKVRKKLEIDENNQLILYLGGFRPVKGPLLLLKVLASLRKKVKNVKVIFVGDPKSQFGKSNVDSIMQLTASLGLRDMIYFVDSIPHYDLPEYYSAAAVLVIPSTYEACPKVALEAMACEIPVVATSVGGIPELISHGKTGLLVRLDQVGEMVNALAYTLSNPSSAKRMGLEGRKRVEKHFTWKKTAEKVDEIYEEILHRKMG